MMEQVVEFVGNHTILALSWLGLVLAVIYSYSAAAFSKVKHVNNHEATLLMNKEDALVVDIRSKEEMKKGVIVDSRHIPLTQLQAGDFKGIEKDKSRPIIIVCETGMRSGSIASKLSKAGFEKVYNLSGGMADWKAANLPVAKK